MIKYYNRLLPNGYTQLEYIESTGAQYIDTGVHFLFGDEFYFDFMKRSSVSDEDKGYGAGDSLFNNITGGGRRWLSNVTMFVCNSSINYSPLLSFSESLAQRYIEHWKITTGRLDSTLTNVNTKDSYTTGVLRDGLKSSYNSGNNLFLFRDNSDNYSYPSAQRVYGAWLKRDNNDLAFNLVPAKRNSDNILGMYDTVTGNFLTNAGTGDFVAGPEISLEKELKKRYIDSRRVKKVFVGEHQVFGLPPHCVDMGLPSGTLWADCNIDVTQSDGFAASPYQYDCSLFSWGNTAGHNPSGTTFDYDFGGANSQEPWYEGQPYGNTKGNTLQENIPVNAEYDAAKANLGAPWRMPSSVEFAELFNNIRFINADGTEVDAAQADKRVTVNGVLGIYLESKINGARLFFSCSGYGNGRTWDGRGSYGLYWSSTRVSARNAQYLGFYSGGVGPQYSSYNRCLGFAIRPVRDQVEWYGIRWSESLNTVERIGNTAYHRGLPLQSQMRRCVLNDDGTVYKYINNANPLLYEDGTTAHYDGSDGQVMVEIPAYYHESGSETIDGVLWNYIKLYPDTNVGVESKKCYIGAFELIQDNSDNNTAKGCSVSMLDLSAMQITAGTTSINASDVQYLADATTYRNYNYSNVDTTSVKCSYGRPTTNRSRAVYRSICARRGTNWSQLSWDAYNSLLRLYFVEYANFNSQTAVNNTLTVDGYRQGGLGTGVTNANGTQWNSFNSYNPFVPCGVTIPLGNKTGEMSYTFATDEWAEGVSYIATVNSYRGIELPFGHVWKFIDGFNRQGGENNTEKIYTCSDVSKFAENDATGYTLISESTARPSGNIGGIVMGEDGTFWPKPGGSTIYGDYFYNAYANGTWYTLCAGGNAALGATAGLLFLLANYGAGYASAAFGSRLLYTESE